ncbi:hypothetical protein FRB90_008258 [Tulasnella sp. 427]|nr:hypothetical protein FRB90_008258 [Tulasnella sp. 427]
MTSISPPPTGSTVPAIALENERTASTAHSSSDEPVINEPKAAPTADRSNVANTEPVFSAFSKTEKWALISIASFTSLFSPLAANIYFPVIPLLADDFNVSISLMNLTVTVYLIFQGLSPMLWGPLADLKGRRSVYLACLSLLTISSLACALVPTSKWWLLLIFRCFQSSGGASTVALGAGVVADIARPQERGGYYGLFIVGGLLGPCIGPVFGGVIGARLGWRWIFWILAICAGACFMLILLFFPETLRRIVGDGTIQAPLWNRPLVPLFPLVRRRKASTSASTPVSQNIQKARVNPFLLFKEPDVIFILIANGIVYGLFVGIQASSSLLLQMAYPSLTLFEIGLCFLPLGGGCLISSLLTGKFLDWQYKKDRRSWEARKKREREEAGEDIDAPWSKEDELTFPIERSRLKLGTFFTFSVCAVSIGNGWVLDKHGPLAVTLILQFIGAATASVINPILKAMGAGWAFVLLSGICLLVTPAFTVVVIRYGPVWRTRRWERTK